MKTFYCAVRYRIYQGKGRYAVPTDNHALAAPFRVRDYELKDHLHPDEFGEVLALNVGYSYISNVGDVWTRNT